MGSIAHVCIALVSSSATSLAVAFGALKAAHPKSHPLFDVTFAALITVLLPLCVMLVVACLPSVFRTSPETTTLLMFATGATIAGLWLSVGVHIAGARYDRVVLKLDPPVIKRGWPWAALNSCITHVCMALTFGGITVVGLTQLQVQSGGGVELCGLCNECEAKCQCKNSKEGESSSDSSSSSSSSSSDSSSGSSSDSSAAVDALDDMVEQATDDFSYDDIGDWDGGGAKGPTHKGETKSMLTTNPVAPRVRARKMCKPAKKAV